MKNNSYKNEYPYFFDADNNYIIGSKENKIERLKEELRSTDHISFKAFEGRDVSEYGDWKAERQLLRDEINKLEQLSF